MPNRAVFAVVLFALAPAALAEPVRHAGEWQTIIDGGEPRLSCAKTDKAFDKDSVLKTMASMPEIKCQFNNWSEDGDDVTYSLQCTIQGQTLDTSGVMTKTGTDAYIVKSHTGAFTMPIPGGKPMTMPASDMVITSRRLGDCKPGDRQVD